MPVESHAATSYNESMEAKGLNERVHVWVESRLLGNLAPVEKPGWLLKYLFKIPIGLFLMGLGNWAGPHFLMITTCGHKSGRPRHTPLEFSICSETGQPIIMSGWGERSDWVRNLRADPRCTLWMGKQRTRVLAVPLSPASAADVIGQYLANTPSMRGYFERFSGVKVDGSREALLAAAPSFPCFRLQPDALP